VEYENVLVDIEDGVGTITLNRPEKLNAISPALRDDLEAALRDLDPGDEVRVIRLRGAGRAFCPGYDLTPGTRAADDYRTPDLDEGSGRRAWELGESTIARDRERLRQSVDRWLWMWNYRKPIIAQVHAYCLAGGLDLIGTCDIVWAAEGTQFGHPAARALGIPPTLGMLPLKIGAAATKELLFTGDTIDADEARRLGMVSHVVPADELDGRVLEFCKRVAMTPMDALVVHKQVVNRWQELQGLRTGAYEGADYDAIYHLTASFTEFGRISREEGLRAALAWRDVPFAEGPAADHDAANRRRQG
jgi:enoyl-CoA hydratase